MIIRAIKDLVNARLAGEQLTYSALLPYLDAVVDEINDKLHAKFKTFTELTRTEVGLEYNEFPDKYIRTVVAVGAAAKWYIDDEEGIETATALVQQYNNNLFVMMRDYGPLVPEDKKADARSGYLQEGLDDQVSGVNPDLRYIEVPGVPGTSISSLEIVSRNDGKHLVATLVDYTYGSKVIDCGIVNTDIVTIKMDAEGNWIALLTDGSVHKVGNMPQFMDQYLQVDTKPLTSSPVRKYAIGIEIDEYIGD